MVKSSTKSLAENHLDTSLKLIVKTSFIVFLGLMVSKLLGYGYRILIARFFGPEAYGLFSLTLSIVPFFTTLAFFGLTDGLMRFIPMLRAKNKDDEIESIEVTCACGEKTKIVFQE